ncbi:hypothetical protein RFI_10836 [Reticulomyxa filosa]|uniref:Uncharacterized protein n=1 Tax=Reticulomyxa filosa TaxID=46433 RepID=X6NK00_RETFI|nr:hypothetical protein RFI_10836 [Reticulomyxa filosa]|eukprot:ETO26301.1 hypothetical protein RFI_10836 [Reticulomyxa filosa]
MSYIFDLEKAHSDHVKKTSERMARKVQTNFHTPTPTPSPEPEDNDTMDAIDQPQISKEGEETKEREVFSDQKFQKKRKRAGRNQRGKASKQRGGGFGSGPGSVRKCRDYNVRGCRKGSACKFAHIADEAQKKKKCPQLERSSVCTLGLGCPYSHAPIGGWNKQIHTYCDIRCKQLVNKDKKKESRGRRGEREEEEEEEEEEEYRRGEYTRQSTFCKYFNSISGCKKQCTRRHIKPAICLTVYNVPRYIESHRHIECWIDQQLGKEFYVIHAIPRFPTCFTIEFSNSQVKQKGIRGDWRTFFFFIIHFYSMRNKTYLHASKKKKGKMSASNPSRAAPSPEQMTPKGKEQEIQTTVYVLLCNVLCEREGEETQKGPSNLDEKDNKQNEQSSPPSKGDLISKLYERVNSLYPNSVEQITKVLLEKNEKELEAIVSSNDTQFKEKVSSAIVLARLQSLKEERMQFQLPPKAICTKFNSALGCTASNCQDTHVNNAAFLTVTHLPNNLRTNDDIHAWISQHFPLDPKIDFIIHTYDISKEHFTFEFSLDEFRSELEKALRKFAPNVSIDYNSPKKMFECLSYVLLFVNCDCCLAEHQFSKPTWSVHTPNTEKKHEEETKRDLEEQSKIKELEQYKKRVQLFQNQLYEVHWKWQDDVGDYITYDKELSQKLEAANIGENIVFTFSKFTYQVTKKSPTEAVQLNIRTNKKRRVQRVQSVKSFAETNRNKKQFSQDQNLYPDWWEPGNKNDVIFLKASAQRHAEARKAFIEFNNTLRHDYKIIEICFVQNDEIWKHHHTLYRYFFFSFMQIK